MNHRNPIAVVLLSFITFGIYGLVWEVKTKGEMKKLGASIPTAWLLIIPLVNLWWLWKYCEGVEKVTSGKMSGVLAFVLTFLLGIIGAAILQNEFNKVGSQPAPAQSAAPIPAAPGFGGPAAASPVAASPVPTPAPAPTAVPPEPNAPNDGQHQPPQA